MLTLVRDRIAKARENAEGRNAFDVPAGWKVAGVLAVIVGVSALFGGLSPASRAVTSVPASTTLQNDLLRVHVNEVHTTTAIEDRFLEAGDGETVLVADMTIENVWTEPLAMTGTADNVGAKPVGGPDALLQISGLPRNAIAEYWRTDGTRGMVTLQPGVVVDVTAAWIVPADAIGDDIDVTMHAAVLERGNTIIAHQNRFWKPGDAIERTTVPVTNAGTS